ncbi:eIF4 binding protein [Schizosaccharomyces pombe]
MRPIKKSRSLKLPKSILEEIGESDSSARRGKRNHNLPHREKRKFARISRGKNGYENRKITEEGDSKSSELNDDYLDAHRKSSTKKKSSQNKQAKESKLLDPIAFQHKIALEEDDREIAHLEKMLGIKSKDKSAHSKIDKEFGWLLEDLDQEIDDIGVPGTEDPSYGHSEDSEVSDDTGDHGSVDELESEREGNSGEEEEEFHGFESNSDEFHQPETKPIRMDPLKPAVPSLPNANVGSKYVPPSLRKKLGGDKESEDALRLRRKLQGSLNKLSIANISSIIKEIEVLYMENSRHSVTSTITNLLLQTVMGRESMLDQLAIVYAALATALYRIVGNDFGAHLLQTLVERFLQLYRSKEKEPLSSHKETSNLIVFFVELYNFQLVSCVLVYDLIRLFLRSLTELNVEMLLKIVLNCGGQLRSDDPTSLQDIVTEMNLLLASADPSTISVRTKFMVESITNLKENKKTKVANASAQSKFEAVNQLKKFLGSLGNRSLNAREPLRVTLEDIEQIETKGRWWLVGASWNNVPSGDNTLSTEALQDKKKSEELTAHSKILQAAKKLRLNSTLRTSIFVALVGSEDYIDAWERVLKLHLKRNQLPEIAYVILHCVGNEKLYNPFYGLVALKCCTLQHNLKKSFQFSLWDFFNELQPDDDSEEREISMRRIVNLAKLYASLVIEAAQPLTILKHVDFMAINAQMQTFLLVFFTDIILGVKDDLQLVKIFENCKAEKNLSSKVDWFLKTYVRKNPLVDNSKKALFKSNLAMASAILQSISKEEI